MPGSDRDPLVSRRVADRVLIGCMAALILNPLADDRQRGLWVACIREVLPSVSRENAHIAPLADAADVMLDRHAARDPGWRTSWDAQAALVNILLTEASSALDLRRAREVAA